MSADSRIHENSELRSTNEMERDIRAHFTQDKKLTSIVCKVLNMNCLHEGNNGYKVTLKEENKPDMFLYK